MLLIVIVEKLKTFIQKPNGNNKLLNQQLYLNWNVWWFDIERHKMTLNTILNEKYYIICINYIIAMFFIILQTL